MPIKNLGGRPRKYATKEEARQADIEGRQHRRQQARLAGPADFIAYQPLLHLNIPADTPRNIGLRTSCNIQIPQDCHVQQDDAQQSDAEQSDAEQSDAHRSNAQQTQRPNPTQPTELDEDLAIAKEIEDIQRREKDIEY